MPPQSAIAPDVTAEIGRWLGYLGAERRMSPKTLEAYARDVGQFLDFLAGHLGGPPSLKALAKLTPADVRAFMAARRGDGLGSRSLMRVLAGARSFARFLERNGKGKVGALSRRARAQGRQDSAEAAGDRRRQAHRRHRFARRRNPRAVDHRARRRGARPALRLGPAHFGSALPQAQGFRRKRRHHRHRQRQQDAHGAGAAAGRQADRRLRCALPDRPAARRPAVRRRARRTAVAARRATGDGAPCAARSACPTRRRRTPCAIPSPPICWRAAATCARSRNCSGMPRCRPRKSTRRSIPSVYWKFTPAPIRARNTPCAARRALLSSLRPNSSWRGR